MGKFIDLTGQRFGTLTVIKRVENDIHNKAQWLCKCDCGAEKICLGTRLKRGITKNCGKPECRPFAPREDLTGQKFNKLLVLELAQEETLKRRQENPNKKFLYWKCQCECGNIVYVHTADLKASKVKSCGCLIKEQGKKQMAYMRKLAAQKRLVDITGQKFGKLTVIARAPENTSYNKPQWICKCECGNTVTVAGHSLKEGYTQSCGCLGNSLGQAKIKEILLQNNIPFKTEIKFEDLKDKTYLRFDFGIYDANNNLIKLIEYDGRQHDDEKSIWHTDTVILHDKMKNDYCVLNNIPLLRINHRDYDKITLEKLLNENTL